MAYIPEHLIDEIRTVSDVVDVISDYVSLKKKGVNYFGLCPFHSEKTPSFSVNPDKQIFHCFGCGAGGNVFTFIMREENVDFPEAARILAKRAGIEIPEPDEFDHSDAREKESLYYANELAMKFFAEQLFEPAGREALEYLHSRQFTDEDIRTFQLGYAPESWDALIKYATGRKLRPEILEKAGLVNARDSGGHYDRFRHRVMFPIINLSGKVIAFGGRCLVKDDQTPKYVNSPETPIYHKSAVLYGLFQARDAIRETDCAIFVEGYTDVMRLVMAGQKNVVATSGTALTELQAKLVHRYTRNAILLYDSDTAGATATLRGADILVEEKLDVRVAELQPGEDPDSFVQKFGIDALREKLAAALPLLEFKLLRMPESGDRVVRTEQVHSIVNTLARVQDGIERQELVREYAEKLRIDEASLWEEIGRVRKLQRQRRRRGPIEVEVQLPVETQKSFAERSRAVEEELVRIMLHNLQAVPFVLSFMELTDFFNDDYRLIATVLYQLYEHDVHPEPEEYVHYFTEPEICQFVSRVVLHEAQNRGIPDDFKRWAADCLAKLQRIMLDMRIEEVNEQLREREQSGGDPRELLEKWRDLQEQRRRVRPANFMPEAASQ